MKEKESFHYGWVVCFCATFIFFINVGFTNSAFGVHLPYIISALNCTNAEASLIVSIRTAATLLALITADTYIKRLGIKRGLELALIVGIVGFVGFAFAGSLPVYYFGGFCIGIASGFGGFMVLSMLLHEWFKDSLGLVLGICAAGSGVALIILPPILTKLINTAGLSNAFFIEAALETVALLVSFFFVSGKPAEKDLKPYENGGDKIQSVKKEKSGIDISKSIKLLVLMCAAEFFTGVCGLTCNFLTLLYISLDYSEIAAANMYSAVGFILTFSKIAVGRLNDRIGAYKTSWIAYVFMTVSCTLCCLAGIRSSLINVAAIALQGVGLVVTTIMITNIVEDLSSNESFPKVLRIVNIIYFLGILIGSYLLGLLADITGDYVASFAVCAILAFVSLMLIVIVYKTGYKINKENQK